MQNNNNLNTFFMLLHSIFISMNRNDVSFINAVFLKSMYSMKGKSIYEIMMITYYYQ